MALSEDGSGAGLHRCVPPPLGRGTDDVVASCGECGQRMVMRAGRWRTLRWHHLRARWRYGLGLRAVDRYRRAAFLARPENRWNGPVINVSRHPDELR